MNPTSGHPSDRITGSPTDIRRSDRTSGFHPRLTILLVSVLFFLSACRRPEPPAVGDPATDTGLDPAVRAHIRNWVAAAKTQPGDATVRARLGIALAANGLWKEARSAFQATAVLDPDEPLAPMYAATALQELSDGPGSLQEFKQLAQRFPGFAPIWYRVGEASLRAGELQAADQAFATLIRLAPKESRGALGLAEVHFRRGESAQALPLAEQALRLDPGSKPAFYLLGQTLRSLGQTNEARVAIAAGTGEGRQPMSDPWAETAPEEVRLLPGVFQQAEAMSALGRPEGAVALLERIRPFHPDHPGLLNQLGVALNRCGQPQKTLALLDPLSAADPKEAALSEAREAIHLAPRLAQSHLALANAHLIAENDTEALLALDEASRCDPANAEILLEAATIRWRNLHEGGAAMALLNKALEIHPALVPALRLSADIQAATGDSEGSQRTQGVLRWLTSRSGERGP
jgi:tetratricopeptide (TPR) repeat protein